MTAPAPVLPLGAAPAGLTRSAQALYGTLCRLARTRDSIARGYVEVGMAQLISRTGYAEKSMRRARAELVDAALVEVVRVGDGRQRSRYAVDVVEHSEPRSKRPPWGVTTTTQDGQNDHPQRARAESSRLSSQKNPVAPEPTALGTALGALKCPTARLRGRPCARCRTCGTSPRKLLELERRPALPDWCGGCDGPDRGQRFIETAEGLRRCPTCHPVELALRR